MGQQLNYYSKLNLLKVGAEKSSFKRAFIVIIIKPETTWSSYEQIEGYINVYWRIEPTSVEKDGDDL